ncbi:hypothetical protein F5884DRAFT_859815 [Xylogone sp. PMI_703]|nr:hypothetical protein F5884DRAFT_859815 [Xylogone sp. PMI_703]
MDRAIRRRKTRPGLEFILVSGSNISGDAETRKRVRSHVQADYRQRNPKPKKNNKIELEVRPLLDGYVDGTGYLSNGYHADLYISPSLLTSLDASRSDPFMSFPVKQDYRSRQLWDHIYDGTCILFRTIREIGFVNIARESIALNQLLSVSSWHLENLHGNDFSVDHCKYAVVATKSLQERLGDPARATTDEVITTVLVFACYAVVTADLQLLNIHFDGLDRILHQRGGISSLDHNPVLRIVLYWMDLYGSFEYDLVPRYPQPINILRAHRKFAFPTCQFDIATIQNRLEDNETISQIVQSLEEVDDTIATRVAASKNIWKEPYTAGFYLAPVLHDLLSIPRCSTADNSNIKMRECFRLAAILYVSQIRQKFSFSVTAAVSYASKLYFLLKEMEDFETWRESSKYLVWILAVGACCTFLPVYLRHNFADRLAVLAEVLGVVEFSDIEELITSMPWCKEVFGSPLEELKAVMSDGSQFTEQNVYASCLHYPTV